MRDAKEGFSFQESAVQFKISQDRFEANMDRHDGVSWNDVVKRLETNPLKFWSIRQMELSGGEPDVVGINVTTGEILFLIVQRKALLAEGVFATTLPRLLRAKKTNLQTVRSGWPLKWKLKYSPKKITGTCNNWVNSILKHRVGWKPRLQSVHLAGLFFAIEDTTMFSFITMAPNRIMRRGGSGASFGFRRAH